MKVNALHGRELWRMAFTLDGLVFLQSLSGLIDIKQVLWLRESGVVGIVMESKDKTGSLFNGGRFPATKMDHLINLPQGIFVDASYLPVTRKGSN